MVFLVARQVLTLLENDLLTKTLEHRVLRRTAELQESEQRFAALVQHSSDLVTVVDADGTITYQSESSDRVLGHPADRLVGRRVQDVLRRGPRHRGAPRAARGRRGTAVPVTGLRSTWRHAHRATCQVEVTVTDLLGNPAVRGWCSTPAT